MNSKSDDLGSRNGDDESASADTQWSLIDRVRTSSPDASREAAGRIAGIYSSVLLEMSRKLPWRPDDATARDYVQAFLEQRILNGNLIRQADPQKGGFRKFLYVSFRNFARDQARAEARRSEIVRRAETSVARSVADDAVSAAESRLLDVAWAREILQQVIARMRLECQQTGQMRTWGVFEGRLLRPITHNSPPVSYASLAETYGFRTDKEAADSLTTAKRTFRRISRRMLEEHSTLKDSESELNTLLDVFSTGISLTELQHDDDSLQTQRSWILAKALELPPTEALWTTTQLEQAVSQLMERAPADLIEDPRQFSAEERDVVRRSLHDFLSHPPRRLSVLLALKDWLKEESSRGEADIPPAVLSAIYFTVIAAAQADHLERISNLSAAEVRSSIESLIDADWLPDICRAAMQSAMS